MRSAISIGVLALTALLWRQGAALLTPLGMFAAVALPFEFTTLAGGVVQSRRPVQRAW